MYICSTTPGNECKLIDIEDNEFKDIYECTLSWLSTIKRYNIRIK